MTDPLMAAAEKHRADDATVLAALHAVARHVERLLIDNDPRIHDIGADLSEIVMPALACIGEVRP
ncbi:hypothetical protein [Nocardia sp. NPDC049149]|uniref:hypothetical protein n=1 Tax=Nocardia sp. NPDC049149 TaxID=3364315 RepID=UPI00371B099F